MNMVHGGDATRTYCISLDTLHQRNNNKQKIDFRVHGRYKSSNPDLEFVGRIAAARSDDDDKFMLMAIFMFALARHCLAGMALLVVVLLFCHTSQSAADAGMVLLNVALFVVLLLLRHTSHGAADAWDGAAKMEIYVFVATVSYE